MRARDLEEILSNWKGREPMTDLLLNILSQGSNGWAQIWELTLPRLEEYKRKFESEWNPISDLVLSRLSQLAKTEWMTDEIRIHLADCLNGGFAWHDSIAFATLPDIEVQKKFLAHELSELITPSQLVTKELGKSKLVPEVAHTVVDMIAYFSVKDFIAKPVDPKIERKGFRISCRENNSHIKDVVSSYDKSASLGASLERTEVGGNLPTTPCRRGLHKRPQT
jgi:hypothetical protein